MLMLLFNLRSQYWHQRKAGSAIKAVINTPCCGNTCKEEKKKKEKKILGVPPISNIKKTTREKISNYLQYTFPQCKYLWDTIYAHWAILDYETSITHVFHKQMSCKEGKQSELYEKAHLVNCSQHTQGKSSQQFLTEEENGLLPSKIISVFST